jgi:hypothetical protein
MKYLRIILLLYISVIAIYAQDTVIYDQTVALNSDFSLFDKVEVYAHKSITLNAGFTFSSDGNGSFNANADSWNIEEPEEILPPGTKLDSTGTLDGSYVVGTIDGHHGVGPSGAANYSIPIEVPPGNKGMVPQLSVNYNSQAGDGMMGRGWNLSGISSITATGKSRYYDNESTAISSIDSACRVVWDGQRILALNKTGLEADSFKTEIASRNEIERLGSGNTMWFRIKTVDGRILEYGNSTDSRLVLGDSTQWKWMINKASDRNGNTVEYNYQKNSEIGEIFLTQIQYGGSTAAPINNISFHYSEREDIGYAYIYDDLILNNNILDSISIESNNEYYGSFGFHYDINAGESLLTEVIQYDKNDYQYNPTRILWQSATFDINSNPVAQNIISGNLISHFSGDFTGDGIYDCVAVKIDSENDLYKYYLYKGSTIGLPSNYDESGDLPRSYTDKYWEEFTSQMTKDAGEGGCSYTSSAETFGQEDVQHVLSGDFDGDGVEEIFIKAMEWNELSNYLPGDLNNGFTTEFLSDFGGFYEDICQYTFEFSQPDHMQLLYGIGHFLNFDESPTSDKRVHTFRLGQGVKYDEQFSQFPDIDGRGYNSFPDNNSLVYYDPIIDSAISYCSITADNDLRWGGDFNADGKADYVDPADETFSIYIYDPMDSTYSCEMVESGFFLGTIDFNGDGISAWVALDERFETVAYITLWLEFCSSCDIMGDEWDDFLEAFDLFPEYGGFVHQNCNDNDDPTCRYSFLYSDSVTRSLGYELYAEHFQDKSPKISFGIFEGEHSAEDPMFKSVIAADISADGNNELLLFSMTKLEKIYYNFTPSYSSGSITYSYDTKDYNTILSYRTQLGDYNGDGIIELIMPSSEKKLSFSAGKPGYLVTSITNGLGIQSRFTYQPLTDNSVYNKEEDADFPVIDFIAPWYVVSSISSDNGVADSVYLEYDYHGAKIHLQGKGFLGFMETTVTNELLNTSQIRTIVNGK